MHNSTHVCSLSPYLCSTISMFVVPCPSVRAWVNVKFIYGGKRHLKPGPCRQTDVLHIWPVISSYFVFLLLLPPHIDQHSSHLKITNRRHSLHLFTTKAKWFQSLHQNWFLKTIIQKLSVMHNTRYPKIAFICNKLWQEIESTNR